MAVNKVIYNQSILIDLTTDTVTAETLQKGYTAHKADGTIIIGEMFEGYPEEYCFYDPIQDSDGQDLKDNSSLVIQSKTVYQKV